MLKFETDLGDGDGDITEFVSRLKEGLSKGERDCVIIGGTGGGGGCPLRGDTVGIQMNMVVLQKPM